MNYRDAREQAVKGIYLAQAGAFAKNYNKKLRTVVIIPGGMGSQLQRSTRAWRTDDGLTALPRNVVWLACNVVEGAALKLGLVTDGEDHGRFIVTPDAEVRKIFTPYNGARWYFEKGTGQPAGGEMPGVKRETFNVVTFGYDWREGVDTSADWLAYFLGELRSQVARKHGAAGDPLEDITLVAHSQGGLVAKLLLNAMQDPDHELGAFKGRLITAGTPFYGTDTIINHFFKTMPVLKTLDAYRPFDALPRMVSNFPGPYILWFADMDEVLTPSVLAEIGLTTYPLVDFDDRTRTLNPYSITDPGIAARFPSWVRPHLPTLAQRAVMLSREVAAPLNDGLGSRVFHLRGIDNPDTGVVMLWKSPDHGGAFDPDNADGFDTFEKWPGRHGENRTPAGDIRPWPAPVEVERYGDGLVPFWSAALADTPPGNVLDLPWNNQYPTEHLSLLEARRSLHAMLHIMQNDAPPGGRKVERSAAANEVVEEAGATALEGGAEVSGLMRALAAKEIKGTDRRVRSPAFLRALYKEAWVG